MTVVPWDIISPGTIFPWRGKGVVVNENWIIHSISEFHATSTTEEFLQLKSLRVIHPQLKNFVKQRKGHLTVITKAQHEITKQWKNITTRFLHQGKPFKTLVCTVNFETPLCGYRGNSAVQTIWFYAICGKIILIIFQDYFKFHLPTSSWNYDNEEQDIILKYHMIVLFILCQSMQHDFKSCYYIKWFCC